ncbi:MAG TPA: ATP synthase F1 subunit gamma [Syntrophomonadaceae bacterium]|nr:ATP synthase F1 subunit gamma [Syntrophomonadaceae bacterium]
MGENLRDIKRRIRSIKNTEQITKAMEMVAAARLRHAQERVEQARPYSQEIDGLIKRVAGSFSDLTHPLFEVRERQNVGYVVFTSDRGLCGAFNSHVIRKVEMELAQEKEAGLIIIGRKGRDYFRRRKYNILSEFVNIGDDPAVDQARGIARTLVDLYTGNIVDEVNLVYTEFISTGKQQPVVYKLLPLAQPSAEKSNDTKIIDYIIEPSPEDVLAMLLPRFIEAEVYRAVLESRASEEASRMIAMSQAKENAGEMIEQLTLLSNKLRQAAITKEISEIVGGAEALKG